jgi:WD40 repeat protein
LLTIFLLVAASFAQAQEKITYQDHVRPIFVASCLGCHNADKKKAGLDLSSHAGVMAGSSNGKVIEIGDPDKSMLYLVITHQQEPFMPQKANKLPDKQLDIIKRWLAGGALDSSSSVAAVASKPKIAMVVTTAPTTSPSGPGPMPPTLSLEPVVRSNHSGAPLALAASPRAPLIAIGAQHQILLYHATSYDLLGVLPFQEGFPKVVTFSRSGALLLAAGGEAASAGKIVLFDVASAKRITEIGQESDEILAADITADQSMVALGGPGKIVKTFSTTTGQPLHTLTKHTDWITALAYSPDGVLLASGDRAGNLRVWEAVSGNEFYTLAGHKAAVTRVCFRPDSNVLLSASEDGTVKLWDMNNGNEIKNVAAHSTGVLWADFAPDGRFVTSGRDRIVRLWNPDGSKLKDLPPMNEIALHAVFSPDPATVISDDWSGQVRATKIADTLTVATLDANPPTIPERIAAARAALVHAQAANVQANAARAAADEAVRKSTADLNAAQARAASASKQVESAQTPVPTAKQIPLSTPQPASAKADATGAAASLAAARQDAPSKRLASNLPNKDPAAATALEKAKAASEAAGKCAQSADLASQQLAQAQSILLKWQQAQAFSELAAARQKFDTLAQQQQRLSEALKQMEQADRAIREGATRIAALTQRAAQVKQASTATTQKAQAAKAAVAEHDPVAAVGADFLKRIEALHATNPQSKPVDASAQKARESVTALSGELIMLRHVAAEADTAAQRAASESAAAESELAAAKAELAAAPAKGEEARKLINTLLGGDLRETKNRLDHLTLEYERLSHNPLR